MIKFVVFDFDGVFTNGQCWFNSNEIHKFYDIKDGKALGMLRDNGILTGLISAYKTQQEVEVKWNESLVEHQIVNHLKFNTVSIGSSNKLDILIEWLKELDLSFENVAYIGDDLTDLDILKNVGFSACPNDAVPKCKEVVNHICQKEGGKGCVREFVELILENQNKNKLSRGKEIIREIRTELNFQLDNINIDKIKNVATLISNCKGNIYFTGIGKSKNSATECCILLKSINLKCFYLDAVESLHGDIGTVREEDLIIMFSKSGNTIELIELIKILEIKKCFTIGVCCDQNSKFLEKCDHTIELPFNTEIGGNITKIPTNSYMSHMLFSNILVSILKEDIDISLYKQNHLGGNIGKHLESIGKYIKYKYPKFVLENSIPLYDIFMDMTDKKMGCSFFVDTNDKLLGILTDGDIRRLLLQDKTISIIKIDNINKNYYYETETDKYISDCKKISYIPILDNDKLIGVCDLIC
jgi:arabinose-5-phosphate isomerase